jgi:hypothetical protein
MLCFQPGVAISFHRPQIWRSRQLINLSEKKIMIRPVRAGLAALFAIVSAATAATAAVPPSLAPVGADVVAPRLSVGTATYFQQHPDSYEAFVAALPHRTEADHFTRNAAAPAASGTWTAITAGSAGLCNPLLLTDGSVLVHDCNTPNWFRLSPDAGGNYADGTWTSIAAMPSIAGTQYAPQYAASAVLPDGRVIIMGGEYNGSGSGVWTNLGAIYDPTANAWSAVAAPTGWQMIGDAQSVILDDGGFLLASCCAQPDADALFQPASLGWVGTGAPLGGSYQDEQGYTKMPGGQVFTVDIWSNGYPNPDTHGELYKPASGTWSYTTDAPVSLADPCGTAELGPSVLRADGTVVSFGGYTGCKGGTIDPTASYAAKTAKWKQGPNVPSVCGSGGAAACDLADAPAAFMSSGSILFAASSKFGTKPTHFFEYGATNAITQVADPIYNADTSGAYYYNFLCLPNGQIMMTDFSKHAELYTPAGTPLAAAMPTITKVAATLKPGKAYVLAGTQLHGVSEGAYYGDDVQGATNYPIVRITNTASGHVVYAPTGKFTTMSILPKKASKTDFTLPAGIETGPSQLAVIANGVASTPVSVTVR